MLAVQAHWQLLIPWQYRTDDLLSHIGDLLALPDFRRISLWLITRQFDKLWKDPALLRMLKQNCTICGEAVSLQYITVHLRLEHQLGPNDLHLIVMQLCRIYSAEHSEEPYCDHCGELLPTLDVLEFDPVPDMHLPGCPLILHMAAFLMHPVLHKSPFDPSSWPSPQAIETAFQRREHQRLMFNVRHSDTAGQDFDQLIKCGPHLLQDSGIQAIIKQQCLLCHTLCILPGKLIQHVRQHDYKQYNTMWCLRRLQLFNAPCSFCGSDSHLETCVCPALLNLAVFLTNGRRPGQSEFDLEQLAYSRPTQKLGHQGRRRSQAQQTPAQEGQRRLNDSFNGHQHQGNDAGDGQDLVEARGHHQRPAPGIRVRSLSPAGRRQSPASAVGMSPDLAEGRPQSVAETHDGVVHDRDPAGPIGQTPEGATQRGCGAGLHQVQPHRREPTDAVSPLGCQHPTTGADQGEASANWRSPTDHQHDPPNPHVGDRNHSPISLSLQGQDGGSSGESSPVSMDCRQPDSREIVESVANSVISQHLATCEADSEATNPTALLPDQAAGQDVVDDRSKFLVRVLENDTATMCYVNAAMTALSWLTLLCQSLMPSRWTRGYELMRGLCQWNPLPLNLRVFQPFLWLLFGAFSEADLLTQQDILEFTTFILDRLQPQFLSCSWCTRFQYTTQVSHPVLDSEKGDRFAPILLRFINYLDTHCSLTDLIRHWHDHSGLCRASDEAGDCIILMFDRHIEGQNRKCQQKVSLPSGLIHFPFFVDGTGSIGFQSFRLAAVTFHLGSSPHSGHHRTALRYQGRWLIYDDNTLPDAALDLSDEILCNITTLWLVKPTPIAVRTMDQARSSASTAEPTPMASTATTASSGSTAPPDEPHSKRSKKIEDTG